MEKQFTYDTLNKNDFMSYETMNKILAKHIGQLKAVLESEVNYCDDILTELKSGLIKLNRDDYVIDNLEYLIHDLYQWPYDYIRNPDVIGLHEPLNCNFETLKTILEKIKGHD